MGAVNKIPGVSGGTVAFVTGIYEDLLNSIKKINFNAISILFTKGFKEFYEEILTTPYDFKTKDSISLNFKSLPYAKTLNGLKAIWRKRFKLSTLEHYSSLKEQQTYNMAQDSTYQFKSDLVLEEEARAKTKKNITQKILI